MLRGADSSHGSLLAQAMELCTRKYGRCQWPMITEECWQENIDWMLESGLIDQKVEVSDVMVDLGE